MNQPPKLDEKPKSGQRVNNKIPAFIAHHSRAELKAMGKALRDKCSRISHGPEPRYSRSKQRRTLRDKASVGDATMSPFCRRSRSSVR
jgi:hypothetical protein